MMYTSPPVSRLNTNSSKKKKEKEKENEKADEHISHPILVQTSNENVIKLMERRIKLSMPCGMPTYNIRMPQMTAKNVSVAFHMDKESIYLQNANDKTVLEYPNEETGRFDHLSSDSYIVFDKNTPSWTSAQPSSSLLRDK